MSVPLSGMWFTWPPGTEATGHHRFEIYTIDREKNQGSYFGFFPLVEEVATRIVDGYASLPSFYM